MKTECRVMLFICISVFFTVNANAQMKADGKWHYPDSVRSYCLNTEQNLVAMYKSMIELNRDWADTNSKSDKSNYAPMLEATKKAIADYEISWDRLGCAGIIYGARK